MVKMIRADKWLSDFFGREIVQAKVAADNFVHIDRLQKQGFIFVEGEVEFAFDLAKFSQNPTACSEAKMSDLPELISLFGSAFPNSRFRPPYFSIEENQRFYQTWIENAVKGEFDDICLIKRNELGQLQGAITVRLLAGKQAKIGLLAVEPRFQQQGIGSALLHAAIYWAKQQQVDKLFVATQSSNLKAARLYQSLGANIQAVYYWFYPAISSNL
ncbi:dTDP-4-amino-4,6-dideoxy-D-galactose acyltransferase [Mannheimia indoligenes]|uniref:dTDP-4-amino-4,6-dideoxy-D-galactose acyltransferase n=1 Tax=Mannheimia indoligenes TaxID=3103145 RepID=UPI002FE58754